MKPVYKLTPLLQAVDVKLLAGARTTGPEVLRVLRQA